MDLRQTQEFYLFLRDGLPPEGCHLKEAPKLTAECAFGIIYILQEYFGIIPPYNKCPQCGELYDSTGEESDTATVFTDNGLENEFYPPMPIEVLKKYDGMGFCSMECLIDFLEGERAAGG
jgi:hypothetical protein